MAPNLVSILDTIAWSLLGMAVLGLGLVSSAIVATRLHLRTRRERFSGELPPVSLLKPLKCDEDDLEQNLRSFFELDYPAPLEIVFAATETDDPGLAVARRVAAEFPQIASKFVRSDARFGKNPKVANLSGAIAAASHDLVHQSDANVRVPPSYLRDIVEELLEKDASILTSPVIGVGEENAGAALENLQLSAFIAPAMCLADEAVNITPVCGKSMLFSRSELEEELGGLASVKDVLCEDYVMGIRYRDAGKKVVLSRTPVANLNRECGMERFQGRHGRWLKMRAALHVPGFIGDLLTNPIALAALALLFSGFRLEFAAAFAAVIAAKILIDQLALRQLRAPLSPRYWWLTPLKDLLLLPLWLNATYSRTVVWRGRKITFGRETAILDDVEPDPAPFDSPTYEEILEEAP